MQIYRLDNVPSPEDYVAGLTALGTRVTDLQRRLLVAQYEAPHRTVTSPQLAELADVAGGRPAVNAQYGRLGHLFCDVTGFQPDLRPDDTHRWWSVWSVGYSRSTGFHWEMHPEVATALEQLGWVTASTAILSLPTVADVALPPGRTTTMVTRVIRDSTLARLVKELHEYRCQICDTQLTLPGGRLYAEAHHLQPLGAPHHGPDIAENLLVVCPNHHALCDYLASELDPGTLRQHPEHSIGPEFLDYHNQHVRKCSRE